MDRAADADTSVVEPWSRTYSRAISLLDELGHDCAIRHIASRMELLRSSGNGPAYRRWERIIAALGVLQDARTEAARLLRHGHSRALDSAHSSPCGALRDGTGGGTPRLLLAELRSQGLNLPGPGGDLIST